jgi:DNA-binding MarR family transcriptional regulator
MNAMNTAMASTLHDQIVAWLNLQQTTRVIQAQLDARLREVTSVSWPEFEFLWRLRIGAGHPLRMRDLAAQLLASPSGLTRIADRLERSGMVVRETARENRREVRVTLTPRGIDVLATADRVFQDVLRESFAAHVSTEDVQGLRRILRTLLEQNGAWNGARCEPGSRIPGCA